MSKGKKGQTKQVKQQQPDTSTTQTGKAADNLQTNRPLRTTPQTWPHITAKELTLTDLDPTAWIYTIDSFLSPKECTLLLDTWTSHHAMTTLAEPRTRSTAERFNDYVRIIDESLSDLIWNSTGLKELVTTHPNTSTYTVGRQELHPVGLNTTWRLYRYTESNRFGPHYDQTAKDPSYPTRLGGFTLLLYLSGSTPENPDALVGGETTFYKGKVGKLTQPMAIAPVLGMALLHAQGDRCLMHEGSTVKKGIKWLMRSDVMYA
ncbi:hypothetical protein HDV00_000677 [Rhizophlyctis rosea]|nr:hypothetical protein HDV00_000677 [Rhizophlyctis rosea]